MPVKRRTSKDAWNLLWVMLDNRGIPYSSRDARLWDDKRDARDASELLAALAGLEQRSRELPADVVDRIQDAIISAFRIGQQTPR